MENALLINSVLIPLAPFNKGGILRGSEFFSFNKVFVCTNYSPLAKGVRGDWWLSVLIPLAPF
jgi:hypothetical protein